MRKLAKLFSAFDQKQRPFQRALRIECLCPPQIHTVTLIPHGVVFGGGAFGMGLGYEGGAPMNGISTLIRDIPESSLALSPHLRTQ